MTTDSTVDNSVDTDISNQDIEEGHKNLEVPVYYLRPSDNRARLLLDCPSPMLTIETTLARIFADIKELGLPNYPDVETLRSIITSACENQEHLWDYTIIMGADPVEPKNAELSWSRDYFAEGWVVDDESSAIDFWQKNEHCSVRKNELLARLTHAADGEAGESIFGETISVGKSNKMKIRCGKGITTKDEGEFTDYYSAFDGRLKFKDNTMTVDDVYMVKGDVDLQTGNITHTGSVTIEGDVKAGATINTEGDLLVKGLMEPCDIVCGGTLVVATSIIGDEDHTIKVEGKLEARYITEANIIAYEGVVVSNEIQHSNIQTLGSVDVSTGRIAGGLIQAHKGIKVGTAGASGQSGTTLMAGIDVTLEARVQVHLDRVENLERTMVPVQAALNNAHKMEQEVSEGIQKVIEDLSTKRMNIGEAIAAEYMVIEEMQEESKVNGREEIIVLTEVWSGTIFQFGEDKLVVKTTVHKPRIVQHQGSRVRMKPLGMGNMPDS